MTFDILECWTSGFQGNQVLEKGMRELSLRAYLFSEALFKPVFSYPFLFAGSMAEFRVLCVWTKGSSSLARSKTQSRMLLVPMSPRKSSVCEIHSKAIWLRNIEMNLVLSTSKSFRECLFNLMWIAYLRHSCLPSLVEALTTSPLCNWKLGYWHVLSNISIMQVCMEFLRMSVFGKVFKYPSIPLHSLCCPDLLFSCYCT